VHIPETWNGFAPVLPIQEGFFAPSGDGFTVLNKAQAPAAADDLLVEIFPVEVVFVTRGGIPL